MVACELKMMRITSGFSLIWAIVPAHSLITKRDVPDEIRPDHFSNSSASPKHYPLCQLTRTMSRNIPKPDGNHTHVSSTPHTDSLHTCPNTYIDLHKPIKLTFCCKLCKSIYIHKQKSFQFNNCIFQRMFFPSVNVIIYLHPIHNKTIPPHSYAVMVQAGTVTCEYTPHLFNTSREAGWCDNSNAYLGSDKKTWVNRGFLSTWMTISFCRVTEFYRSLCLPTFYVAAVDSKRSITSRFRWKSYSKTSSCGSQKRSEELITEVKYPVDLI